MNDIFKDLIVSGAVTVYLEDILIMSKTKEEHCCIIRHSTDADDLQISEQISEKIPADVAGPGYPDPWHPDPPDVDMASVTGYIHRCSV